jgi:hypothetical protein
MKKRLFVLIVLNFLLTFSISSQIAVWQQEAETAAVWCYQGAAGNLNKDVILQ